MKKIKSLEIGDLIQDERFNNWWESSPISIPFFDNKKIKITFIDFTPEKDKKFIDEADSALRNFLKKDKEDRLELSKIVYKNCMDYVNKIGEDVFNTDIFNEPFWEMKEEYEIWKYVYPQNIYLTRRDRRDKDIYLTLSSECIWEPEHGLQLVFRRGIQLTRISTQDGHITEADAYDKLDSEDELLSKFKK